MPARAEARFGQVGAIETGQGRPDHPAFLLRSPSQKREAWIDLLTVKRKLRELGA